MEEREYRKIKKGVEVYEKLKKILPTKRCIEQVIRHIYTLEGVREVVEISYNDYFPNKELFKQGVGSYSSMKSYKSSCPHAEKMYFEVNGDIVIDETLKCSIYNDDYLSCDREQFIVFMVNNEIKVRDRHYKEGTLVVVRHSPIRELTMYEKNIARILEIK